MKIRLVFALFVFGIISASCAKTPLSSINAGSDGVAIKGFDPVAYFTLGKPAKGSEQFAYIWNGAKWFFSTKEHLDLFIKGPEKYAPQYGGY